MNETKITMSVDRLKSLPLPDSVTAVKSLFPDDITCAEVIEAIRYNGHFTCEHCGDTQEPYRFEQRPFVLRCRKCKQDSRLLKGSVAEGTKTPLHLWFLAAFILACNPNVSSKGIQRALGLTRYETAHAMVRKIRATHEGLGAPETISVFDVLERGLRTSNPT